MRISILNYIVQYVRSQEFYVHFVHNALEVYFMFNKRLREMRIKRCLTQQKLADLINVALRTYQCYEEGSRSPCYQTLISLADVLNVSIDWLLGRDVWLKSHGVLFDEL